MADRPYRALDPLMGTPLQPRPTATSGSLRQRLAEQQQRKTAEGTFKTGPDGRMEFVPKFVEEAASHAVTATPLAQIAEPGESCEAECKHCPAEGDDEREAMGQPPELPPFLERADAFLEKLDAMSGKKVVDAEYPEVGESEAPRYAATFAALGMSQAELARVMAAPAFDPKTEPLRVGDTVEVTTSSGCKRIGTVVLLDAADGTARVESGGVTKWAYRRQLQLLNKAAPTFDPLSEPLQVGDLVEYVMDGSPFVGWRGKVDSVDGTWTHVEGLGSWDADHRQFLKLIAKATA
jgi:hypothetical protein